MWRVVGVTRRKGEGKHSETKTPAAHNHPKHKIHAYWPPWLLGPLALGLGALGHRLWGQTLPSAAVVPLVLVLSVAVLSCLTYTYAGPRTAVQRWHAVLSVVLSGLSVVLIQMFGTGVSVADRTGPSNLAIAVLFLSSVLALSWNIRRFDVVRGEGQDKHGQDSAEDDWHGLKKPRGIKVTSSDGKKTQAKVKLSAGQTAKDVEAALGAMGSDLGTITNGIRVEKDEKEGEVDLTLLWEDQLTDAVGWEGPESIGGSIADPISLGINEQGKNVILLMAGDYDKGIAPGHVKIVGMPRTGKGILVIIIWANLRARRDVYPVINDASKGEQLLMFLRPGMPKRKAWIDKTESGAKAQASAIKAAIKARSEALGDAGYSSWTPEAFTKGFMWKGQRIHMPAIVFHVEEFAPIGIRSPGLFTTIGEQGLSAGIFLVASLQRASNDRFPTSLRSVIGNGICCGAFDDMDVTFALPSSATEGGASPAEWGQRFPGRAMASLNGQPAGMERIPFKTHYAASKAEFEDYVKEMMAYLLPMAPDLDPCTAEAFGQAYQDYLASDETAATPSPRQATTGVGEDDEEGQDEDDMDDDEDGTYVMPPAPEGCDASHIDPEQAIPDWTGPDIDLSPPPQAGRAAGPFTPERKREIFHEILQACADRSEILVTTGRLNELWIEQLGYPETNQTPTVNRFIVDACVDDDVEASKPNDLMGTLEPEIEGKRGRWRVMVRPRVAAMNGHHA